jgi:hypothetical protein
MDNVRLSEALGRLNVTAFFRSDGLLAGGKRTGRSLEINLTSSKPAKRKFIDES